MKCSCGKELTLADNLRGKRIRCPDCRSILTVPASPAASPPRPQKPSLPAKPSAPPAPAPAIRPSWENEPSVDEFDTVGPGFDVPFGRDQRAASTMQPPAVKKPMSTGAKVAIGCGVALVGGGLCLTALVFFVINSVRNATSGANLEPLPDAASVTVPADALPERPAFVSSFPSGVELASVRLQGEGPGMQTAMQIYRPRGIHRDQSLGCVLVAPAGTNLLTGSDIDGSDYHDEALPYAEAGFLVIKYSLDGPTGDLESAGDEDLSKAYREFRAAGAGTINTRCVLNFVKARLPEVSPQRIYTAGHSSAGTVSLLAAQTFPDEISGCIAYAPCSDPEAFHAEMPAFIANIAFPGYQEFDQKYSPIRNAAKLKCPLYLFQARDDSVVSPDETKRMADAVRQNNRKVMYAEVPVGEHYESMIREGIPGAITWLRAIDAEQQR
ncbi:MAG: prolyl oligopeptidase family serine peptidase [Planctomycetaceae bacterium]|nr:prolyl oligopeptidase family serine peptidase [Planctomycetaceae bacterium]